MEVYYDMGGSMFVVDYSPGEWSVGFECRELGGYDHEGPVFFEDGCINYDFPGARDCMLHECGRSGLVALGVLLGRIHDQCAALMGDKCMGDIGAHPVVVDVMPWARTSA